MIDMKEKIKGYLLYLTFQHKKKTAKSSLSDVKKDISVFEKNVKEHILDSRPDVSFHSPFQSVKNTISDCIEEGYITSEQGLKLLEKQVHSNKYDIVEVYDQSIDLFLDDYYKNKATNPRLKEYYDVYKNGDREELISLNTIASIKWNNTPEFHSFSENMNNTRSIKIAENISAHDMPSIDSLDFGFTVNPLGTSENNHQNYDPSMQRFAFQNEEYRPRNITEDLSAKINWGTDEFTDITTTKFNIDSNELVATLNDQKERYLNASNDNLAMKDLINQETELLKEKQEILSQQVSFPVLKERFKREFTNPFNYSYLVNHSFQMTELENARSTNRENLALDHLHVVPSQDLSTLDIEEEKVLAYKEELNIESSGGGYTIPRKTIENVLNDRIDFLDEDFTNEFKKALEEKKSLHTNVLVYDENEKTGHIEYQVISTKLSDSFDFNEHDIPQNLSKAVQTRLGKNSSKLVIDAYERGLISSDQRDYIFYKAKDGADANKLIANASAEVFAKNEQELIEIKSHIQKTDFTPEKTEVPGGASYSYSLEHFSTVMSKDPTSKDFIERIYSADRTVLQNIHKEVQENIKYDLDPVRKEIQQSIFENKTFTIKDNNTLFKHYIFVEQTQDGLFGRQSVGFYDNVKEMRLQSNNLGLSQANVTPYKMVEKNGVTKFHVQFKVDGPAQLVSLNQKTKIDFIKDSVIRGYITPELADEFISENLTLKETQRRTAQFLTKDVLRINEPRKIFQEFNQADFKNNATIKDFEKLIKEIPQIKTPLNEHINKQREQYSSLKSLYETSFEGKQPVKDGRITHSSRFASNYNTEKRVFLEQSMLKGYINPQKATEYLKGDVPLSKIQHEMTVKLSENLLSKEEQGQIYKSLKDIQFSQKVSIREYEDILSKLPKIKDRFQKHQLTQKDLHAMKNFYQAIGQEEKSQNLYHPKSPRAYKNLDSFRYEHLAKKEIKTFLKDSMVRGYITPKMATHYLREGYSIQNIQEKVASNLTERLLQIKDPDVVRERVKTIGFSDSKTINEFENQLNKIPQLKNSLHEYKKQHQQDYGKLKEYYKNIYHNSVKYHRQRMGFDDSRPFKEQLLLKKEQFKELHLQKVIEPTKKRYVKLSDDYKKHYQHETLDYQEKRKELDIKYRSLYATIKYKAEQREIIRNLAVDSYKEKRKDLSFYQEIQQFNYIKRFMSNSFEENYKLGRDAKQIHTMLSRFNKYKERNRRISEISKNLHYSKTMELRNQFFNTRFAIHKERMEFSEEFLQTHLYNIDQRFSITEKSLYVKGHLLKHKRNIILGIQRNLILPKSVTKSLLEQINVSEKHRLQARLTVKHLKKSGKQLYLRAKYRKNAMKLALNHMRQTIHAFDGLDEFQKIFMSRKERRAFDFLNDLSTGKRKLNVINSLRKRYYYRKMFGSRVQRITRRVQMLSSWVVFYGVSSLIRHGDEYVQDSMKSLRNIKTIQQLQRYIRQRGIMTAKLPYKYIRRFISLNKLWRVNKAAHIVKGKKLFILTNFLKKDKKIFRKNRPKASLLQIGIRVSTMFQSINSYGADSAKATRNIYTTARATKTTAKGVKKVAKTIKNAPRNIRRAKRFVQNIGRATIAAIKRLIRALISLVTAVIANIIPIVAAIAVIVALVNFAAIFSFFTDMFMVREEYDPATQFYNRVTKLDYDKNKQMNKDMKNLLKTSRDKYYKAMRVTTGRQFANLGFTSIEVPYIEKMVIEEPFRLNDDPTLVRTDAIRTLYYLETLYGTDNLEQFTTYDIDMSDKIETPADIYQDPTLGFQFLDKEELTDEDIKNEIRGKIGTIRGNYSYTIGDDDIKAVDRVGTIYRDPVSQLKKMHDEMHHIAFSEIVRLRSIDITSDSDFIGRIHIYGRKTGSEPFDNWFNPTYVNKTTSFGENIVNLYKNDTGIDKLALLEGGEDRISTLDDRMNGFFYEYENPLGYEEESGEGYSWIRRNPKEYYSITDGEMLVNEKNQYDFPTTYIRRRYGYEGDQDTNAIWKSVKGIFTKNDADDDKNVNTVIDIAVSNGKTSSSIDDESGEETKTIEGTKVYAPMGGKVEVASNSFSDSSESFSETNRIGGEYIIIKDVLKKHAFEGSVNGSDSDEDPIEQEDATEDKDLDDEEILEEPEENQDEMMMMMIGGLDKVSMEAIKERITETENEYMVDEGDLLGTIKLTERDQPKPRFPFQGTGNSQGLNALSSSSNDPGSPIYRTNLSAKEWEQVIQNISGGNSRLLPANTGNLSHGFFDALVDIEQRVGINSMFLLAIIQQENSGVTSDFPQSARTAREKNNLFSVNAIDSNPSGNADTYLNYQDSLISAASLLSRRYLDPSKPGHFKSPYGITVRGVAETYCSTSESWAAGVSSFMGRLHSTIQSMGFGGKHDSGYVASASSTGGSYNPNKLNIPNVPSAGTPTTGDAIEGATEPDRTEAGAQENLRPQEYKELSVIPFYPTEDKRTISNGKEIRKGVVLANPATIAKSLTVKMDSYGYGVVEEVSDTVGAGEIFIGFDTKEEADNFGQQTLRVAIYPEGFIMPTEGTADTNGNRKKKEEVERTAERIEDIQNYESILYMNMFYQYTPDKDESKIMKLIHGKIRRAYLNPAMRMASGPIDQTNAQSYMLETGWAQLKNEFEEYMDGSGKVDTSAGFMGGTGFNGKLGAAVGFDPEMKQFIHHPKVIPGSKRQLTLMWAATHQGIPYQLNACHGGWNCSYKGIDCSAFVSNALYHAGIPLKSVFSTRTFMSDVHPKTKITDRSQLIPGDIVLMYNGGIGHIEIFLGDMPAQRRYLTVGSRSPRRSPSSKGTISYYTNGYTTYLWRLNDHDTMASEQLVHQYINEIRKHDPTFTIPGFGHSPNDPSLIP